MQNIPRDLADLASDKSARACLHLGRRDNRASPVRRGQIARVWIGTTPLAQRRPALWAMKPMKRPLDVPSDGFNVKPAKGSAA